MLNSGCRDSIPVPAKNYLCDVVIRSASGEEIGGYAIVSGNLINAKVPYDGSGETRFKVDLKFPDGIGNVNVTPSNGGVYDFAAPQRFTVRYGDGQEQVYVMEVERDTLDLPRITRFEIRFATPEISYANTATGDRYIRFAEGTDLAALEPWIHFNKPTVRQLSPGKTVDFSQGPVVYQLVNGNQYASYTVTVSNYGYGKHMPVADFTQANKDNRFEKLAGPERSLAFDNTGSYLYVANGNVLQRYQASGNKAQTPADLSVADGDATLYPAYVDNLFIKVNDVVSSGLYGCNRIENGGIFKMYYWASATAAPTVVAEIDFTARGATIDCFTWKVVNNRIHVYLVDTAPMRKPVPEDPKIYLLRDIAAFNRITSFEEIRLAGAVGLGAAAAPQTTLAPIDGTNDFLLSNAATSPIYVKYVSAAEPLSATSVFPETSLLPKTIMGIRTFNLVRGKYIAWVEFSPAETTENSAFLTILDVTKSNFKASIDNIIAEGAAHTTLAGCTRFRIPLGKAADKDLYGQVTLFPIGAKLRIACCVAGNGINAFEWE